MEERGERGKVPCEVASFKAFFIDFWEKCEVYTRIALSNFDVCGFFSGVGMDDGMSQGGEHGLGLGWLRREKRGLYGGVLIHILMIL